MTWLQTYTGKAFDLKNPSPDMVCIEDIAHHLANQCRFLGACRVFYSVAQHSVLSTELVPLELKKQALVHDSPETYCGDWPRPLKVLMKELGIRGVMDHVYGTVSMAIGVALGVDMALDPKVKLADDIMLATEKRDLMAVPPQPWVKLPDPRPEVIEPWSPAKAEYEFLRLWYILNR